jgi:hypothetical protein
MPRLTKDMRDEIVRKVLHYKFAEEEKALAAEGGRVFDAVIDAVQGEYKDKIAAVPEEYFHRTISFSVRVNDSKRRNRGENTVSVSGTHPRAVPEGHGFNRYSNLDMKEVGEAAYKLAHDYAEKVLDKKDRRSSLKEKLTALVYSVTTTKRLYEVWPELAAIVPEPKENQPAVGTALTVSVAELNKIIPLPPPKQEKPAAKSQGTRK